MKKIFISVLLFLPLITLAQSTEILPGTVLPQMTTAERTGIATPENGILVFDTTTQSYWYRQSGAWAELPQAGSTSNYWQLNGISGNEIKNTNSGGLWSENSTGLTFSSNDVSNPPTAPVNGNGTRMMWIPNRSAFRAGSVSDNQKSWDADSIGIHSFAAGLNTKAIGNFSTAMGKSTNASGTESTAIGNFVYANGNRTTAIGYGAKALGNESMTMGYYTQAEGYSSTALGHRAKSTGNYSAALGANAEAAGDNSIALGNQTLAGGGYSTAMGNYSIATGDYSTAMGDRTTASGEYSTAIGWLSAATTTSATAIGYNNEATGEYATAIGNHTTSSGFASIAIGTRISTEGFRGSFVISDYVTNTEAIGGDSLLATAEDQFSARFENGYRLYTDNNLSSATKYGVFLNNKSNSWSSLSDSTKKERFLTYDPKQVLSSVATMRVGTWNYKGDHRSEGRHWGVMAQDFYHHFGKDELGTIGSDTLIATADFDGVSFAAIQALELRTRALQEENERLQKELAARDERMQEELAARDDKYLQLFAEMRAEMIEMKSTAVSATKSESK
ncbi:tail fiber domain-containing protein [Arcticibacterium luteifluviistationis]|uniref:Peptidase S74 domain-containing protein n=1 Tax=Arcticibacterium luteifluviistationis TaxID=1784714 RepID=A0A2Z4GCL2_9BACT|nr:tail fiber domain-containing protein [Arcticibacterium luteifluviistationis]AWV98775.1 hypothetical protein DJ013_11555 [Arcticibacterium luteifluviistationis]